MRRRGLVLLAALALAAPAAAQAPSPRTFPNALTQGREGAVIYTVATLQTGPLPPEILKKLEPIHTLVEAEALLKASDIPFAWAKREMNSGTMEPGVATQLANLPRPDVFVIRAGQSTLIGEILDRR